MGKNIGFVFKVIDGNNISLYGVIAVWNVMMTLFFGDVNVFKIPYSIRSNIPKDAIVYTLEGFFRLRFETFCKLMNAIRYIHIVFNFCDELAAIWKILCDDFVLNFYRGNRITADIRKAIV